MPCGSNAGMETSAPLVNVIVNNAVLLRLTHQSDANSNHSYPALLSVRLVASHFVINWIEVRALQWPQIWKIIQWLEVTNDAHNVRVDTAHGKDIDQQNLLKVIMW